MVAARPAAGMAALAGNAAGQARLPVATQADVLARGPAATEGPRAGARVPGPADQAAAVLAPAGPRVPGPAAQAALVARAGVAAAADQRDVARRTGGLASQAVPRGMAAAAGLAVPRGPVVPVDQLVRG